MVSIRPHVLCAVLFVATVISGAKAADESLLQRHCAGCHSGDEPAGDLAIEDLGSRPGEDTMELWTHSLDRVIAGEMPPPDDALLTTTEKRQLEQYLYGAIKERAEFGPGSRRVPSRRLNNREFRNSVRDVLGIEDVGTHLPTDNLLGDSLYEGFDTHGETLGLSYFHLEQYVESLRKIVDATILTGPMPQSRTYRIDPTQIAATHTNQNTKRPERRGTSDGFDFLDPKQQACFEPFRVVSETGWYRIRIQCTGLDRGYYDAAKTGIYDADPIRLTIVLGDRNRTYNLPDNEVLEIELTEWLAEGTRVRLRYPTDGLTLRSNGNFKFQNAIAGEHIREHDPGLYTRVVSAIRPTRSGRVLRPESWHHWVDYWRGPRPRILSAEVEGPFFESWPPQRQMLLLGDSPSVADAERILRPIAAKAWRREVQEGELDGIIRLVHASKEALGDVGALKEGIVAVLASPRFLLVNTDDLTSEQRFASKVSLLLAGTLPDLSLSGAVKDGQLKTVEGIEELVRERIVSGQAESFLKEFPFGWLQLNEMNFMAPDPDQYRYYHRKRLSEDMTEEVLLFFRHAVENDVPVPELLTADYSFLNADLAKVYGVADVPRDSQFRRYTYSDDRRGGFLGMGAFLTLTADSLGTSPIHRAVYVMENFFGVHPSPPPPDVPIEEPDIRSAVTIREVLEAHRSDESCASCHRTIDPYGYAFENFDPVGTWRDVYTTADEGRPPTGGKAGSYQEVLIDASARFPDGTSYQDIRGFRRAAASDLNQRRFVRCFVIKLLTYANGEEPKDYAEIQRIVEQSEKQDYRMIPTIAAVIDSPLFREERALVGDP